MNGPLWVWFTAFASGVMTTIAVRRVLCRGWTWRLRARQARQEQRALHTPEHGDVIEEDRLTCPRCYEQRNPGTPWFLSRYQLCRAHAQEALAERLVSSSSSSNELAAISSSREPGIPHLSSVAPHAGDNRATRGPIVPTSGGRH